MLHESLSTLFVQNQAWYSSIWLYTLLALVVAVEGPIATLAAAVASSLGYMDPKLVFLSASCGNLSGDIVWYSLGYMGKTEWLKRFYSWFGIKQESIVNLEKDIDKHIRKLLFIAKLTLGLVVPTLIAAGLARVSWRRWLGILLFAESIWTGSLVLAGYYYGQYIQRIESGLKWLSSGAAVVLVIGVGIYLLYKRSHEE